MELPIQEEFELTILKAQILTWEMSLTEANSKLLETKYLGRDRTFWFCQTQILTGFIWDAKFEIKRRSTTLQKGGYVDVLERVKTAWIEKYRPAFTWESLCNAKIAPEPYIPPEEFPESHIRIENGKCRYLVVNTPPAIDKALRGVRSMFSKPPNSPFPAKRSVPKAPKELNMQAILDWHKADRDELRDRFCSDDRIKAALENVKEAEGSLECRSL